MKVLVVDDSEDVRILVTKWLTDSGYIVQSAANGSEGITKLSKDLDLIFLDIMMPGPKTEEIIKKIKAKSPKAIVIYLTAVEAFNLTKEQEEKKWKPIFESPVMGYLQKPISKEQLLAKIKDSFATKKIVG
ncbi:MAG: response regulator [Patescibacteria group bacterium]|nr:response regulator [Patescibacteria group bacterium]